MNAKNTNSYLTQNPEPPNTPKAPKGGSTRLFGSDGVSVYSASSVVSSLFF
jgi:hypothetical protein